MTADQIRSFQDYFDTRMSGNLARRRQTKFMPSARNGGCSIANSRRGQADNA
jgi:hypothetical protein